MSEQRSDHADEPGRLTPTEAFELLAHDTRVAAMRALWETDEPLRYSEIADRAEIPTTANFNYHFRKLVGHFVRKEGEEYSLTRSGRQAMTAVIAGDVTGRPAFAPVGLDRPCPYCGAAIELHHDSDALRVLCTECPGTYGGTLRAGDQEFPDRSDNPRGTISVFGFPPGGLAERDPGAVLEAALSRLTSRYRDMIDGLCPDCAGPVDRTAGICDDHDPEGVCGNCGSRFAGLVTVRCRTCRKTMAGMLPLAGLPDPRFTRPFEDHGLDLLSPTWEGARAFFGVDERVHSLDPVDYEAAWTIGGESVSIRIDGDASVTDVLRE